MKAQLLPIFPEPIVEYKNLGIDQDRIRSLYEQQSWVSTNPDDNPDYFLKISQNKRVLNDDKDLKSAFENVLNAYTREYMLYENRFYITTCWFTRTESNKISILHNHGNAMFSAVYYFGLPDQQKARITFERPVISQIDLKPKAYNVLNGPSHVFEMANDSLLIFPSYLKHKVNRHEDRDVRKSLAMNFLPQGVVGAGTNEINLIPSAE